MMRAQRRVVVAICLVGVAGLLGLQLGFGFRIFTDDPFISYRYARNWIRGEGLVFNPGERVEGYTNFLWTALLAGGMALGADPIPLSKLLGLACNAATLVVLAGVAHGLAGGWIGAAAAVVLLATNRSFLKWGGGGLETPLFGLLALAAAALAVGDPSRRRVFAAGICGGLALLTRPEGALLAPAVVLDGVLEARRAGTRAPLSRTAVFLGGFLLVGLPHELWRWAYYGYPLPNTYYAKMGAPLLAKLVRGATYTIDFHRDGGDLGLLLGLALGWRLLLRRGARLLIIVPLLLTAGVIWEGGDWMPYNRFFVPLWPLLALALGAAVAWLLEQRRPLRIVLAVGLVGYVCAQPVLPKSEGLTRALSRLAQQQAESARRGRRSRDVKVNSQTLQWRRPKTESWMDWPRWLGQWLRRNAPPGATIALGSIGIIPYYSDLPTIDFFGITDEHIAHRGEATAFTLVGHQKFDLEYILDREPTYIIFAGRTRKEDESPSQYWVKTLGFDQAPRFRREYAPVTIELENGHIFQFYQRKESVSRPPGGGQPRRLSPAL